MIQTITPRHNSHPRECVPSIGEDAPVEYPKKEMEEQFGWRELLLQQCEERHLADWFPLLSPYGTRYIKCRPATRMPSTPSARAGPGMLCGRWPRGQSNWLWRGGKDGGSVSDVQSLAPLGIKTYQVVVLSKTNKDESNPATATTQTTEPRLEARRSENKRVV